LSKRLSGLLLAAILLFSALAFGARGEVVLLLRTEDASQQNLEALNRLQGELSLHGFRVVVVEAPSSPGPEELERLADEHQAVASVGFSSTETENSSLGPVDIWISDRVTGTTSKRTIQPGRGKDAPGVLAVRALELLRASLRASHAAPAPEDVVGAHPKRAKRSVRELSEPPPQTNYFFLSAAGAFTWALPDGAPSGGPELGFGYHRKWAAMGLVMIGPTMSEAVHTPGGLFRSTTFSALAEPGLFAFRTEALALELFSSLGATYLSVDGEALSPYEGRTDTAWLFTLGGGLAAHLQLTHRLHLTVRARALQLLPRPKIQLIESAKLLGSPLFASAVGLRLNL